MIKPVGKRVLVEIIHESPKTEGGLYRPHYEKFLLNEGVVREVSDEVTNLKPGDRIILPRYEGMIKIPGEKHLVFIDIENIEGVIYEEDL